MKPCVYKTTFEEEKVAVVSEILDWGKKGFETAQDLDQFESMIAIKSIDLKTTRENAVFRKGLAHGSSKISNSLESQELAATSNKTDKIILEGVMSLEFEHVGNWENNRLCSMISYKRLLGELNSDDFKILLITRTIDYIGLDSNATKRNLAELLLILQKLDLIDQNICRGIARGDATKETANSVGLTTRSVELRRQKILDMFGFQRPIEIVKMLVRLQENGLIDGWC